MTSYRQFDLFAMLAPKTEHTFVVDIGPYTDIRRLRWIGGRARDERGRFMRNPFLVRSVSVNRSGETHLMTVKVFNNHDRLTRKFAAIVLGHVRNEILERRLKRLGATL